MLKFVFLLFVVLPSTLSAGTDQFVTLIGTCEDSTIRSVSVLESNMFLWYFRKNIRQQAEKDLQNKFVLRFQESEDRLLHFGFWGYETPIYVTPGDSVQFQIYRDSSGNLTVDFKGRNKDNYNYYPTLQRTFNRPSPWYQGDLNLLKNQSSEWANEKRAFNKRYWKEAESSPMQRLTMGEIDYEEYCLLLAPFANGSLKISAIPHDHVPSIKFNMDDYLPSGYYRDALNYKYIFCASEDIWNNFDLIFKSIVSGTTGRSKDLLIASALGLYAREQRNEYRASLLKAFKVANSMTSEYASENRKSMNAYLLLNRSMPDSVLELTILIELNTQKKYTLEQVLQKYTAKPVYLDFWASWCSACRLDIKESTKSKKYLDSAGITLLYFSIDKNENSWIKAAKEDNITNNQFLVVDGTNSAIGKFLEMQFIPRYVIFDKNHHLKDTDAPRLNPDDYGKLVEGIEEAQRVIVNID